MLNCGATIDLAANLALTPALKCLVLDSHKPIHINNVHGSEQVLVVKDSSVSEENVPSELSESEEDESEEDEETRKRQRERREAHENKRRHLIEYNAFNYYSCPCSMLVAALSGGEG